ncbi:ABC transporter substrate-binding protein [Martelella soudanensis]|uniref:ABC transporter substrate-binding protein n=1 Tax=unclassified Martelella TaxID=2629616 RepID=UPI0015DFE560|nr:MULTISPECIES: sugar ABC transporter substrate-binding protein [unclassified Martelella]
MKLRFAMMAAAGALMSTIAMADPVTITMYTFYTTDVPFYEKVFAAYEEQHPDVTIDIQTFENTAYDAALRTAFASGEVPDIICVEPDARAVGMYPLIEADLLKPLNDLYGSQGWDKLFFPSVLDQLDVDGTYYSIPVDVNNFSLFYNKTMLDKYGLDLPHSYADLQHMADVLGKDGIYPIAFGNQFPQRGRDYFYMLAGQLDHSIITDADSGDISWDDPRLVEAAQKLKDMADDKIFMPGINAMSIPQGNDAFLTGRAAMVLSGPWDVKPFTAGKPDDIELGVMRFPPVFDGVTEGTSPGGVGKNYAIPAGGKHIEEAEAVMAYLLSEDVMKQYVADRAIMAPYAAANVDISDPLQKAFVENQESNVVPRVLLNADTLDALGNAIQGVLADEVTAEEGMQEVEDAR